MDGRRLGLASHLSPGGSTNRTLTGLLDDATASADPGAGGTLVAGRYEILGLIGSGGMGTVYRARDASLDEVVALKVLRPEVSADAELVARFRREVKLARSRTRLPPR